MIDQKEINERYLELQVLEQQLKQVNQQLLNLDNQLLELQRIEENLNDLTKTKKNTEMLVALGGGVFSKAELKDNKSVLMNVGIVLGTRERGRHWIPACGDGEKLPRVSTLDRHELGS